MGLFGCVQTAHPKSWKIRTAIKPRVHTKLTLHTRTKRSRYVQKFIQNWVKFTIWQHARTRNSRVTQKFNQCWGKSTVLLHSRTRKSRVTQKSEWSLESGGTQEWESLESCEISSKTGWISTSLESWLNSMNAWVVSANTVKKLCVRRAFIQ